MKHHNINSMFSLVSLYLFVYVACCSANLAHSQDNDSYANLSVRQRVVEETRFIQIPGPNPIIRTGPKGAWDDMVIEASDAIKDVGTYYFYYHGRGSEEFEDRNVRYQIGVATSTHPLGPFKKYGDNPVLKAGPEGSWDDQLVACAMVFKDTDEKYYMWYCGYGGETIDVGLASAEHPLGPWKKYEGNPLLKDFGYVGGMVKVNGKYYLYDAHPVSAKGYKGDYSPLALAVADSPEGPWVKHPGNPLMVQGSRGNWDDGGISEAEVLYHNGMFHMFYGGTELFGPRLESIGYAYSFDGINWTKYGQNPVARRQANPNAAAFAEVHAIIEPPFVYLYHTLRPEHKEGSAAAVAAGVLFEGDDFPWVEDLGVQVLVTETPFSLDMPVLELKSLDGGAITTLADSPPISLGNINRLSLTAECIYSSNAKKPIRIHVRASYDGVNYDTLDLYTLDHALQPGRVRKTFELDSKVRFVKVLIKNQDKGESVTDVKVTAMLGS